MVEADTVASFLFISLRTFQPVLLNMPQELVSRFTYDCDPVEPFRLVGVFHIFVDDLSTLRFVDGVELGMA
jgi:hypothetical protein